MTKTFWRSMIVTVAMLLGVAVSHSQGALAHAEPESSVPPAGATVAAAPPQVEIVFSEEVTAATTINVVGPDGNYVAAAPAQLDLDDPERKHVTVALFGMLPDGVYTVTWSSISAEDGDANTGSYTFTIGDVATPSASPMASPGAIAGVTSQPTTSPSDQVFAAAEAAQQAASAQAAQEDNFDGRAYFVSVLAGLAAAIAIFIFWRIVRPKPNERYGAAHRA